MKPFTPIPFDPEIASQGHDEKHCKSPGDFLSKNVQDHAICVHSNCYINHVGVLKVLHQFTLQTWEGKRMLSPQQQQQRPPGKEILGPEGNGHFGGAHLDSADILSSFLKDTGSGTHWARELGSNYQTMFNRLTLQGHKLSPCLPNNALKTHISRWMDGKVPQSMKSRNSLWRSQKGPKWV